MTGIRFTSPDAVVRPIPVYNHIAEIPAGARILALAGQVGQRPDGEFDEGVEAQFAQALANIVTLLTASGGGAASVARLTCYLSAPLTDLDAVTRTMQATFGDAFPAMTVVYVAGLYAPHVKAEIEALAAI